MTERKMATVRKIDGIFPIEGADAIEVAQIGGWKVVTRKGEYKAGDLAVYCEIDSFIPTAIAPFLTKADHYPKVFEGVEGERLRTVRLRKQLSQGLLLPVFNDVTGTYLMIYTDETGEYSLTVVEGDDVSEALGITKYEAPVPVCLQGEVKGMFPGYIPKTDQERIQNLTVELAEWKAKGLTWSISEKCEGQSVTTYFNNGEFGVCSRNLELKPNADNTLWATANKYDLQNKLTALNRNIAVQAELLGPGIQGNIYKMTTHMFAVFDIFDIDTQQYMPPVECKAMIEQLGLTSVPVFNSAFVLTTDSVDDLLKMADGQSVMGLVGCKREGLVYKCNELPVSFKTISNSYLLSEK